MCIIFMYDGRSDTENEYSFILASNRDEMYRRPAQNMAPWPEDPQVIGGRDIEAGGTWFAISPSRRKLGVLLNLPRSPKPDAKSRGKIVMDYVSSDIQIQEYVNSIKTYAKDCNDFVFVAVELSNLQPSVHTYSNESDLFVTHTGTYLGFGNSQPDIPLKKVEAGKVKLKDICCRLNKTQDKQQLEKELIDFLRSQERHFPDPELELRRPPEVAKNLSSIFVCMPELGYGTRTHTLVFVSKSGHMDVIELTLQPPIDIHNPNWHRTEYQFDISSH